MSLRTGYILALSLILILAALKFSAMMLYLSKQSDTATVINVSGRQRMLSQRTAFFAASYVAAKEHEKEQLASKLKTTADEFFQSHIDLIEGNPSRNLPKLESPEILAVYHNAQPTPLDHLVRTYIANVEIILNNASDTLEAQQALAYISEIGPDILLQQLNEVVNLHEKITRSEVSFLTDLQIFFLLLTVVVLIAEGSFLFRPMVNKIDAHISELKKRKEKIQQQINELQHITYVASHDLQEPLRKVTSFTQKLEKSLSGKMGEKEQNYMKFIMSSATRMHSLISSLQAYTRILSLTEEPTEADLNETVQYTLQKLVPQIKEKEATITYDPLPKVMYNHLMLEQVFEHLLRNAITYHGETAPVVHIDYTEDNKNYTVRIHDKGIGIEEKYHERIFELFKRLHRKEDIPGIGFGLTATKKIIEQHGGEIWVTSRPQEGSCFSFTIPKQESRLSF